MKGNLTEHAVCCGHYGWWHSILFAERKPFALPGTFKRYAPDVPIHVHHVKLALNVDPERRMLSGVCTTTFEPIADELSELFFEAQDLKIESVSAGESAQSLSFEMSEHGFKVKLPKTLKRGEKFEVAVNYSVT